MNRDRADGAMLGLAVGDAMGMPVEFRPRGKFEPVTEFQTGGPFKLQAGQWTDDTAMSLCLASSLIECNGFDAAHQMKQYSRWIREGKLNAIKMGRSYYIEDQDGEEYANDLDKNKMDAVMAKILSA